MDNQNNSPKHTQGKNSVFAAQMKIVFAAFRKAPKTMYMASVETGIERANICRYVAKWKRSQKLVIVKNDFCEISKYRADYYTTAPDLFTKITPKGQMI
jgi:hypothetical protein